MASENKKFSGVEVAALLGFAVIFDVISFIPILNVVSGIIAWAIVYGIFFLKGVSFTRNTSIVKNSLIAFIVGLIPGVSALPELTIAMALNLRAINKGEKVSSDKEEVQKEKPSRMTRTVQSFGGETPAVPNIMNRANVQGEGDTSTLSMSEPRKSNAIQFGKNSPTTFTVSGMSSTSSTPDLRSNIQAPKVVNKVIGKKV